MLDIRPQTIRSSSGEELVVITRAEYDALVAAAVDAAEDAADVLTYDERKAELAGAGVVPALPPEVTGAMLSGDSLLRALRKWKKMTQLQLADRTGLAQGYISDLEARRKVGSPETLRMLAMALDIDQAWLGAP